MKPAGGGAIYGGHERGEGQNEKCPEREPYVPLPHPTCDRLLRIAGPALVAGTEIDFIAVMGTTHKVLMPTHISICPTRWICHDWDTARCIRV